MAAWKKLGLFAGGGNLPLRIAEACRERRDPFYVVRLKGFADSHMLEFDGEEITLGQVGRAVDIAKEQGCDAVMFVGNVQRPDFSKLALDWRGVKILPGLLAAAARGDGALLDFVVETAEAVGLKVVGAETVLDGLAAPAGALGAHQPAAEDLSDIAKAIELIKALGPFDVGQGAVVSKGHVLAVEAAEGTDAMLARCAGLPEALRGGVLVKRPKPDQERRIDLPVIGAETVRRAHAAGLSGISVEAGGALIIDQRDMVCLADECGLFIYGHGADDVDSSGSAPPPASL